MAIQVSFRNASVWHRLDLTWLKWGKPILFALGGAIGGKALDILLSGTLPSRNATMWLLTLFFLGLIVLPGAMWLVARIANHQREMLILGGMFSGAPIENPEAAALFDEIGRGKFVVGSAVTIALAPSLNRGWALSDVELKLVDDAAADPPPRDADDGKKIAVRTVGLAGTDLKKLPVGFEVTRFSRVQDVRALGRLEKLGLLAELDAGNFNFPSSFCIHAIIVTADRRLLLTRRSTALSYYPGTWSASLEEQLTYGDILAATEKGSPLQVAALRMLSEEIGLSEGTEDGERAPFVHPESIQCLSVFAETDLPNISTVLYVPLAMSAARLTRWLEECPRKDHEFTDFLLLDVDAVALVLAKGENCHPTTRYRMALALRRWLGGKEAIAACVRAKESDAIPLTSQRDIARANRLHHHADAPFSA